MPRTPISKILLYLLVNTGQTTIDFLTFLNDIKRHQKAYLTGGYGLAKEYKQLQEQYSAREALRQLQRSKYLKAQKVGKRLMITLTEKGVMKTMADKLCQANTRIDGLHTMVIFDVPQSQNEARRQLRLLLRQGGFIKLQQSVWVSRNDAYDLIAQFIKQAKLEPWVNVFRARDFLHSVKKYS